MAPDATVAPSATLAGDATVAPRASLAPGATVARGANNKDDDDKKKSNHHQKGGKSARGGDSVENHSCAAQPRERPEHDDEHLALVQVAYEKATGNKWNDSDSSAYEEHTLYKVPAEKIVSAVAAVARRTTAKINSFKYFVKEIVALPDPRKRAWQKKQLEKIVRRIRDNSIGRADYSTSDFIEDVKCACARESVPFDNDVFNDLTSPTRPPIDRTA